MLNFELLFLQGFSSKNYEILHKDVLTPQEYEYYYKLEKMRKNKKKTCRGQSLTVPKILNDTDTDTFFRYQIFTIPIPVLFTVPKFSDTGSETFFRYQILPIPVPRLFSGTIFFRYHGKN